MQVKFIFASHFLGILVYLVYFIIPIIITLVLLFMFGAIGAGFKQIVGSLGIWVVFAVIIFILFGIFELAAQSRFAISHSISDALNIGEVVADVKRIGICFDFQLVAEVPTEDNDIKMNEIISLEG